MLHILISALVFNVQRQFSPAEFAAAGGCPFYLVIHPVLSWHVTKCLWSFIFRLTQTSSNPRQAVSIFSYRMCLTNEATASQAHTIEATENVGSLQARRQGYTIYIYIQGSLEFRSKKKQRLHQVAMSYARVAWMEQGVSRHELPTENCSIAIVKHQASRTSLNPCVLLRHNWTT